MLSFAKLIFNIPLDLKKKVLKINSLHLLNERGEKYQPMLILFNTLGIGDHHLLLSHSYYQSMYTAY